jgi:hypothetical protein
MYLQFFDSSFKDKAYQLGHASDKLDSHLNVCGNIKFFFLIFRFKIQNLDPFSNGLWSFSFSLFWGHIINSIFFLLLCVLVQSFSTFQTLINNSSPKRCCDESFVLSIMPLISFCTSRPVNLSASFIFHLVLAMTSAILSVSMNVYNISTLIFFIPNILIFSILCSVLFFGMRKIESHVQLTLDSNKALLNTQQNPRVEIKIDSIQSENPLPPTTRAHPNSMDISKNELCASSPLLGSSDSKSISKPKQLPFIPPFSSDLSQIALGNSNDNSANTSNQNSARDSIENKTLMIIIPQANSIPDPSILEESSTTSPTRSPARSLSNASAPGSLDSSKRNSRYPSMLTAKDSIPAIKSQLIIPSTPSAILAKLPSSYVSRRHSALHQRNSALEKVFFIIFFYV